MTDKIASLEAKTAEHDTQIASFKYAPAPEVTSKIASLEAAAATHASQIEYLANLVLGIFGKFYPAEVAVVRGGLGLAEEIFGGLDLTHGSKIQ